MKAIIRIDVPDYQIGQEVSIYFKDTMMIKGIVQEPKTDVLDKIRAEIGMYEADCRLQGGSDDCERCITNVFGSIYRILHKYKAESEDKE